MYKLVVRRTGNYRIESFDQNMLKGDNDDEKCIWNKSNDGQELTMNMNMNMRTKIVENERLENERLFNLVREGVCSENLKETSSLPRPSTLQEN